MVLIQVCKMIKRSSEGMPLYVTIRCRAGHALFSLARAALPKAYLCEAGNGRSACIADVQLAQTETAVVNCTFSLSINFFALFA
jgi:hypothetical protein